MAIVMKFGGTSVADAEAFKNVARIVREQLDAVPIVVVSAMSGVTDALLTTISLANQQQPDLAITTLSDTFHKHRIAAKELLSPPVCDSFLKELAEVADSIQTLLRHSSSHASLRKAIHDEVLSYGEMLSSNLLAKTLCAGGVNAQNVDARLCVITDDDHGNAAPLIEETFRATNDTMGPLLPAVVPVLGGFFGSNREGHTTTLGRGGSDYTAALVGAALRANEIQIWTDVTGVLTADPRVVADAQTVERLSYGEAAELAYFGAKVLHPKTIQPAIEGGIPVRICNSREPERVGTVVCAASKTSPHTVKAIAHKKGVTTVQITSARMLGAYGFLRALFEVFERHRTVVDVVTTSEVSVSLSLDDATALPKIVEELEKLGTVRVERNRAIICVVGEGLRGTPGIASKVFSTISDINVTLISQGASSINLTLAVEEERAEEAVRRLHQAFFVNPKQSRG